MGESAIFIYIQETCMDMQYNFNTRNPVFGLWEDHLEETHTGKLNRWPQLTCRLGQECFCIATALTAQTQCRCHDFILTL